MDPTIQEEGGFPYTSNGNPFKTINLLSHLLIQGSMGKTGHNTSTNRNPSRQIRHSDSAHVTLGEDSNFTK